MVLLLPVQIEALWRTILAQFPTHPTLWLEYFRYRKSQFSWFSVERYRGLLAESLATVVALRDRALSEDARQGLHVVGDSVLLYKYARTLLVLLLLFCAAVFPVGSCDGACASLTAATAVRAAMQVHPLRRNVARNDVCRGRL